jgi:ribosomal protein L18E
LTPFTPSQILQPRPQKGQEEEVEEAQERPVSRKESSTVDKIVSQALANPQNQPKPIKISHILNIFLLFIENNSKIHSLN